MEIIIVPTSVGYGEDLKCKVLRKVSVIYSVLPNWDFPGGPAVKTPRFQCRGPGFDP